jgi:hypothetical protein
LSSTDLTVFERVATTPTESSTTVHGRPFGKEKRTNVRRVRKEQQRMIGKRGRRQLRLSVTLFPNPNTTTIH